MNFCPYCGTARRADPVPVIGRGPGGCLIQFPCGMRGKYDPAIDPRHLMFDVGPCAGVSLVPQEGDDGSQSRKTT